MLLKAANQVDVEARRKQGEDDGKRPVRSAKSEEGQTEKGESVT